MTRFSNTQKSPQSPSETKHEKNASCFLTTMSKESFSYSELTSTWSSMYIVRDNTMARLSKKEMHSCWCFEFNPEPQNCVATRSSAVSQNVQRSTNRGRKGQFVDKSATPSTLRDVPWRVQGASSNAHLTSHCLCQEGTEWQRCTHIYGLEPRKHLNTWSPPLLA